MFKKHLAIAVLLLLLLSLQTPADDAEGEEQAGVTEDGIDDADQVGEGKEAQ